MVNASNTSNTIRPATVLGLDADQLNACVSCGLCLPHCPTYRVTEEESASPRGRISMMRAVESGALAVDDDFVDFMERCVMCRGCETACPSGVPFGALMEGTRNSLALQHHLAPPAWMAPSLRLLEHHRLLLAASSVLGAAQRLRLVPDRVRRRFGLPASVPVRRAPLVCDAGTPDVWLYTGCVMDAWQRDVHAAAMRVVRAAGATVATPTADGCCGALHAHAGRHDDAMRLARGAMASLPGTAPILVDSAGCGAQLKHVGDLLDTETATRFSARVLDIHEWLASRIDRLPSAASAPRDRVAVQDPCHLRHVQRGHLHVRTVLERYADVVEIADDGRCCGAGGSYSVTQPELARDIRAQKIAAIRSTGCTTVASANPGCSLWLADGGDGLRLVHPVEIIDAAIGARP